jgi:hypothetical protein
MLTEKDQGGVTALLLRVAANRMIPGVINGHMTIDPDGQTTRLRKIRIARIILRARRPGAQVYTPPGTDIAMPPFPSGLCVSV